MPASVASAATAASAAVASPAGVARSAGAASPPMKASWLPRLSWRQWWELIKRSASAWIDDYAPSMGAALSYYTVFSMAPLLLIVISIAGLVFGDEAARGEIFGQLSGLMGADAAKAIEDLLQSVNKPAQGIGATVLGIGLLVVGATTVFGELQDALDRIWRAPAREAGGIWGLLRARLLSFGMILGIAFLLMVSLVLGAVVAALGKWWGGFFGGWEVLLQIVNTVVGFALTTVVFAMIYKLMPRVHVRWHDVWLGAIVTSLLFTIGKFLIGLYIGKSGVASGFGAAGSLIVVFIWVYYSAQVFLLGAEFTWIYARMFGSMRHLEAAEAAPPAPDVPIRDASAATPAGAAAAKSASAAEATAPMPSDRELQPLGVGASLKDVAVGLGIVVFARWLLPKIARRL